MRCGALPQSGELHRARRLYQLELHIKMTSITAAGTVGVPPAEAFAFLSDLRNHWLIWVARADVTGLAWGPARGFHLSDNKSLDYFVTAKRLSK